MKLWITSHAVERYMEQVKPALEREAASAELLKLVARAGTPGDAPPDWLHKPQPESTWLTLSDGVVAACIGRVVTTVVTRGSSHPRYRAHKNKVKASRRARKKKPPFKPGMGREAGIRWR